MMCYYISKSKYLMRVEARGYPYANYIECIQYECMFIKSIRGRVNNLTYFV